eukprot:1966911-Prymnesium_polylepis.1
MRTSASTTAVASHGGQARMPGVGRAAGPYGGPVGVWGGRWAGTSGPPGLEGADEETKRVVEEVMRAEEEQREVMRANI